MAGSLADDPGLSVTHKESTASRVPTSRRAAATEHQEKLHRSTVICPYSDTSFVKNNCLLIIENVDPLLKSFEAYLDMAAIPWQYHYHGIAAIAA